MAIPFQRSSRRLFSMAGRRGESRSTLKQAIADEDNQQATVQLYNSRLQFMAQEALLCSLPLSQCTTVHTTSGICRHASYNTTGPKLRCTADYNCRRLTCWSMFNSFTRPQPSLRQIVGVALVMLHNSRDAHAGVSCTRAAAEARVGRLFHVSSVRSNSCKLAISKIHVDHQVRVLQALGGSLQHVHSSSFQEGRTC